MSCDQSEIIIEEGGLGDSDVDALLAHHFAEMRADSPPEACHVLPAQSLRSPTIRFFTVRDSGGELLGVGALQWLEQGHGEVKSMRTAPALRRSGVAARLLEHLIREATARGYRRLSLETGAMAFFEPARRLYRKFGFEPCGPFAAYKDDPNSVFLTKFLVS